MIQAVVLVVLYVLYFGFQYMVTITDGINVKMLIYLCVTPLSLKS